MERLLESLTAVNGFVFRITHRDNLPWILRNGLICAADGRKDSKFVAIGNPKVIGRRESHTVPVPPGGHLSDYVPFYFTPFSPMAYNIRTGRQVPRQPNDAIVIFMTSVAKVADAGARFVFTDRHAYMKSARYSSDPADLPMVDFALLRQRNFQRSTEDPERVERYQAEFLVHGSLELSAIRAIACYTIAEKRSLDDEAAQLGVSVHTIVRPWWYFQ